MKNLLKVLGPGILFASTAVGVSHLVQSTRAGAVYGFGLVAFVILANLFKYPFFEFGSRYANATGKSILTGYLKKGKWILWVYLFLTLATMFTVTAAVTFVTGGLMGNLFNINLSAQAISGIVFLVCILLLGIGRFHLLDNLLKIVAAVLLVSTLTAFIAALINGPATHTADFIPPVLTDKTSLVFIIALMGWMPTALDLSTWNSIWTVEKIADSGYHPTMKETLFDFNFGYLFTAFLSLCFLTLGAYVVYGTGTVLSDNSVAYAGQLIGMYTETIGPWVYMVIAAAAFSTMFSTSITVIDGYSRALRDTVALLRKRDATRRDYLVVMLIVSVGSFLLINFLSGSLKQLVDLATTLSFVIAPVIAIINYVVMMDKSVEPQFYPPKWLRILAISGIVFLSVFTLIYIVVFFIY